MKGSIKTRYHVLITILLGLVILQSVMLLYASSRATRLSLLVADMQSIVIIFTFVIFIYLIVIYNYIPYRLNRSFKDLHVLVDKISDGDYHIDIDSSIYGQDENVQGLIISLQKMITILVKFDQLKADKIYEHHQRIQQLISLISEPIIIVSAYGDTAYCNEALRTMFIQITESVNLNELILKDVFQEGIIFAITDALRNGNNLYNRLVEDPATNRKALINGYIIRNRKGLSSGAVYILKTNTDA
ncbi:MAG: hypothetical protein CVU48_04235 [Candidatus Cloacimonetes bacterium HGW-Cloacimonetes-1]|nr:MAG: hypothetical protein CVU48_04235 [Candidatus Cloacimonetes bacterium HGW-Cloacimonetes-1]